MKKRILSVLLSLCMVLTLLPAEALAAELQELAGEQQDAALEPVALEPDGEEPEQSGMNGETPMEDELSTEEVSTGDESDIMPYADPTGTVDYTLENGAVLTFDPSTGTIAKCTPNNAKVIVVPEKLGGVSVSAIGDYAFDSCSDLTSITIPDGVTTIGLAAFRFCSGLISITIPDSITSIGGSAFSYCEALTSITIPDGVTSISGSTFAFCRGLTSITLPDSVTSIGEYAFGACVRLTSITIPDSVTSIGREAFESCHSLTNITIPDGVTSIADRTFWDCSGLTSITIPDSVTSIEPWAFVTCISLTSIKIPDGVTSIGALTFYGCSSLTSITLPGNVTSIGPEAFRDCSSLTSITIPDSVTVIGNYVFDGVHKDFIIYCYPESYAEIYAIDNGIHYVNLLRSLSVSVLTPEDTPVTEGFTVTWYDETGNEVGTGLTLLGAAENKTYAFDVQLSEALASLYEQPQRQTITRKDGAVRVVRLVPRRTVPIPTLILTGRVLDKSGRPVAGAEISIGLESGKTVDTVSGADGSFTAAVPYETVQITVQKGGYYKKTLVVDLRSETAGSFRMDDCILTEVVTISDRLTLNITQRLAAEDAGQALEIPVTSAKALTFVLTGSGGRSITDFETQGTALLFHSGAVSANETIYVRVEDPAGAYVGASAAVTLDHNRMGSIELTMTQKGSFRLGSVSGPEARLLVFNDSGKCIQSGTAQGGMSGGVMDAGEYMLVFLQKSALLPSAPDFSYLQTLGLTAGRDYLLREITIVDGKVSPVGDCVVPTLNESAFSYLVAENTSVTVNKLNVAAGEQVLVRISYELNPAKAVSDSSLHIILPDGVSVLENSSATVNGSQIPYTYDSAKREVRISVPGQGNATVYFYCAAVETGSHSISAFLSLSSGAVQPVGSAVVQVETAKLDVVDRTAVAEGIVASGKTLPNSTVILYDNDEVVGRTKSNAVGSWSMKFNLVQPVYSYSYHFIRAVTEIAGLSGTVSVSTEEALITYSKDFAGQVTKITMYNTGDHGPQTTVFDFTNASSTARPYYRMWPSRYPTFTFKVEFSGNASKLSEVYMVTTNSAGEKTYVETTYDPVSGAWVGTHDYTSFNDAPMKVGAAYKGADDEIFFVDEDMLADLERKFADLDNEISDILIPMFEEMLDIEILAQTENSIQADVIFTDPETNERKSLGSVRTTLVHLEPGIKAEDLEKQGYQLIDEDNQIWTTIGEGNFEELAQISTIIFFDLKNETSLTIEANAADKASLAKTGARNVLEPENVAGAYCRWVVGMGLGLVLGGSLALAGAPATVVGAAVAIIGPTAVDVVDTAMQRSVFQKKMDERISGHIGNINQTIQKIGSLIYTTCSADGNYQLSEEDRAEFHERWSATLTLLSSFITESYAQVSSIKDDLVSETVRSGMINTVLDKLKFGFGSVIGIVMDMSNSDKAKTRRESIEKQIDQNYNNIMKALKKLQSDIEQALTDSPCSGDGNKLPLDMMESPGKSVTYIADPSGYVYEAVPSNLLEGVKAVISSETGGVWNATDYDQVNPQLTGADGSYYWDVPQGNWRVSLTKEGYEPADTSEVASAVNGWLPVPPPQLGINVGMISTASPAVKQAVAYTDRTEVVFSQYMDIDSVIAALSLTVGGIVLTDVDIEALDAENNLDKTAQYATRFAIVYRGDSPSEVVVSVAGSAKNYAKKTLQSPYKSGTLTTSERPTGIDAPEMISIGLHQTVNVSFDLLPGVAGQALNVKSLTEDLVRVVTPSVTTNEYGEASIKLEGLLPGGGLVQITDPVSGVSVTIQINISLEESLKPVTATLVDGTVVTTGMTLPAGTAIYLSTATEGAVIRYTLNDTCPCKNEALVYGDTPVILKEDTVLRVAAYKDGVYSTTIRLMLYVAPSGGSSGGSYPSASGSSIHQITLPAVSNGTVTVNPKSARSGAKVTITVKPNTGYELDTLTVTDNKGNTLTLTDKGDGTYIFTMPNANVSIDIRFKPIAPTTQVTPINFTDVQPGAYYYDAVAWAVANGITYGITDTTFSPDVACTRAQIVSFLWRQAGSPKMGGNNPFTDVSAADYYYDAMLWAVANGITYGTTDTTFSPDDICTRAQAMTFLYRNKKSPAVSGTGSFTDVPVGEYYTDAVHWAVTNGVTYGTTDTTFSPEQDCTRAQIVSFMYRARAN